MPAAELCGCGKPKTHKGNCWARWAVRKANHGPTGIKAKPVSDAGPLSEEEMARRLFGELAADVLLLRKHGHTVARFHDRFRVDRDALTDSQLRARAKALRSSATQPRSPAHLASAEQPAPLEGAPSGNAAVVPPRKDGRAGERDLSARLDRLEQQMARLFDVVADAINGRRACLVDQAKGLAEVETNLRRRVT
jgi:hypothetical protein